MTFSSTFRRVLRGIAPAAMLVALMAPHTIAAQTANQNANATPDHVVSSQMLNQQLTDSSATRRQNIDTLQKLLDTPTAQKAMHDAKVDPQQVKTAIPTLSDQELANLSARVTHAQHDFAAGYIGPGLFTILILVVVLIIIVLVVH